MQDPTIDRLFERAVREHVDRPAVSHAGRVWTYGELGGRVRGLAAALAEAGVGPGDRVAVLADNTPFFLAAYLAAPLARAVLQPLNTRLAPVELEAALSDAETRLVLVEPAYAGRIDAGRWRVVAADLEREEREAPSVPTAAPDDLAQLYYTSGTTGRPKGVMLTHRNVCTHAAWAVAELELTRDDRWGHFAPMFHLADAWASFAVTMAGGAHVMQPRFTAAGTLSTIERERVTLTNLVPTMLTAMVAAPEAASCDPSSLRMILSGGAPITPALVRRIVQVFHCEYVQTYGMTETSPYLTVSLLREHLRALPEEERLRYAGRTGRAFGGIELEVVDEAGRPVPADDRTVGEIRVRGASVSPGYWRRPEETAEAHRAGWLHTGDLAVVDAEGYVDIVDRKKDVIVTGAENVYSAEVERVLAEHPRVREVAVFGLPDATWGERVCAAVVPEDGGWRPEAEPGMARELEAFCRRRLAGFKVPRRFFFTSELPRTGSGKVSKHLLRERS